MFAIIVESSKEHPDFQITRMFFDALEAQIREKPEYYLWWHKRWKLRKMDWLQPSNRFYFPNKPIRQGICFFL